MDLKNKILRMLPWLSEEKRHRLIQDYLSDLKVNSHIRLNLGSGEHLAKGYINCDLYNPKAELQVDIRKLSSKIKIADLIEAHHVLEHLSLQDSIAALRDWVSILKPGGYLIITVPDFELCLKTFLKSEENEKWDSIIKMIYGSQENKGMYHKSAFSPTRLRGILNDLNIKCQVLVRGYPKRPTPSFLYVGLKTYR